MTLSRNNKIILAVAIAAALLAGFWFLVLAPKRTEAASLDTKIQAKQAQASQAQTQLATYEKARTAYKANYAKLVSLGKAAPADDDVRSLMVQLDQVAGRGNVTFDKVEVGSDSSTPATATTAAGTAAKTSALAAAPGLVPLGTTGVSALPFELGFDGSYMNLSNYFRKLQRFVRLRNDEVNAKGRLVRVESIDISPASTGWPGMVAKVGAASYVVDPLPTLGSQTAGPATGTTPSTGTTPPTGTSTTPATTTATVPGVAR